MMMKQEEQISRYFDHAMSAGEEQNFLIALAASDAMRIAFRSQLELMKAVRHDADDLRSLAARSVPDVRNRTLTALGLSATAVTPFIEQELHPHSAFAQPTSPLATPSAPRTLSFFARPKYALATGLFLGFLSAVTMMNVTSQGGATHQTTQRVAQPMATPASAPAPISQNPLTRETIPPSNALHTVTAEPATAAGRSAVAAAGHHHVMHVASNAATSKVNTATSPTPTVSKTNPAKFSIKPDIEKPADGRSPAGQPNEH